jgi:hypothetical protein
MDDPPRFPGVDDDTGLERTTNRPPGTPRWVKVFAIVALVAVLLLVVLLLVNGGHGPSRHTDGLGTQAPLAGATIERGSKLSEGFYG